MNPYETEKLLGEIVQPVRRRQYQPRARHAERMAERDGPAMRVDVLGVVGESKVPQAS